MLEKLSASAQKVQHALLEQGFAGQVQELPDSTRTAKEAAQTIGCEVAQIVKSLIFKGSQTQKAILVVASGVNRVNEKRLGELAREPIEKANADFVRQHTGYAVGGVPPLAHAEKLETFIDEDLLQYEQLWAAAGTPFAVFPLTPVELQTMTSGEVVSIK
ncbi:YbaK/EbsC family protein [Tengunoibacter tsumagoiensis]|uniref:Prolyl-tRNA editing protein n=1 Tax=Tengunoibacter tsumagoiensis TaxID=2014871 RepID=A0A402A0V1_9CHLR|nr:YbaK/EbsC family protein [Tengunoibacter tsumagoiensis]GCE12686.1 prolyl-tRNA editing protein [Tengunoibacter tsumagoiensis]